MSKNKEVPQEAAARPVEVNPLLAFNQKLKAMADKEKEVILKNLKINPDEPITLPNGKKGLTLREISDIISGFNPLLCLDTWTYIVKCSGSMNVTMIKAANKDLRVKTFMEGRSFQYIGTSEVGWQAVSKARWRLKADTRPLVIINPLFKEEVDPKGKLLEAILELHPTQDDVTTI